MKKIKSEDMIVYYYTSCSELEKLQEELQIRSCSLEKDEKIRICPREGTWHILLRNTGNTEEDTKTLQDALGKFRREFREGL